MRKKQEPWKQLIAAAKQAQDLIAAEHHNATAGDWDSEDAMQVFENIECALLDIQESGINADAAPDLLKGCAAALEGDLYADAEGIWYWAKSDTEDGAKAIRLIRAAIAAAKIKVS